MPRRRDEETGKKAWHITPRRGLAELTHAIRFTSSRVSMRIKKETMVVVATSNLGGRGRSNAKRGERSSSRLSWSVDETGMATWIVARVDSPDGQRLGLAIPSVGLGGLRAQQYSAPSRETLHFSSFSRGEAEMIP
jgi:hypothetical protein